jgi:hypothetical protein
VKLDKLFEALLIVTTTVSLLKHKVGGLKRLLSYVKRRISTVRG